MKDRFERTLSVILVAAAAVIAAGMLKREFLTERAAAPQPILTFEKDWKDFLTVAEPSGDTAATVKVMEFSDLECRFCKIFHKNLREVLAADPKGIVAYFIHYPNEGHRFALPAARAAECARSQGRFSEFVDAVFEKQDSLGLKSWGGYALDAGLSDTSAIRACAMGDKKMERITEGAALGRRLRVTGTPTILFNGWRIQGSQSKEEIRNIVEKLKKGEKPFAGTE